MSDLPEEDALRRLIKTEGEQFRAPAALRARVLSEIHARAATPARRSWFQTNLFGTGVGSMSGAFAGGALLAAFATWYIAGRSAQPALYALAADHARAVVTSTAIEVPSSDNHTVKPWLSAKLGYSPNVVDLADAQFPLLGGRRGFLGGVPLAVMVYGFKQHEIDVYAIRSSAGIALPGNHSSLDGYHVATWSLDGIDYVAMSDIDSDRLDSFAKLLNARQAQPAGE